MSEKIRYFSPGAVSFQVYEPLPDGTLPTSPNSTEQFIDAYYYIYRGILTPSGNEVTNSDNWSNQIFNLGSGGVQGLAVYDMPLSSDGHPGILTSSDFFRPQFRRPYFPSRNLRSA